MARFRTRAQADASQASILVLIIMIAIILYVLLLPGPIRDDLLNGNNGSTSTTTTGSSKLFVDEHPGTIDYISQRDYTHDIPSFNLYKSTNAMELKKLSSFYVKSSLFSKKVRTIPFDLADRAHTKNVLLSFDVSAHHGVLYVLLNGNTVFEGEVGTFNAEPITLDADMLQDKNTLEFYAEDVGLAFWRANDYTIQNLRIVADITDTSQEGTRTTFIVTRTEADNTDRLFLKFNPNCDTYSVGRLDISMNDNQIFSGIPDCGILNTIELNPALLKTGENSLQFKTDKGSYLVDLVKVESFLKDNPAPIYYFEVSSDDFAKIQGDQYYANLTVEFVDAKDWKEGSVIINGHETNLYTHDRIWKRTVDDFMQDGQNSVKIVPKDTFNIVRFTVSMNKR